MPARISKGTRIDVGADVLNVSFPFHAPKGQATGVVFAVVTSPAPSWKTTDRNGKRSSIRVRRSIALPMLQSAWDAKTARPKGKGTEGKHLATVFERRRTDIEDRLRALCTEALRMGHNVTPDAVDAVLRGNHTSPLRNEPFIIRYEERAGPDKTGGVFGLFLADRFKNNNGQWTSHRSTRGVFESASAAIARFVEVSFKGRNVLTLGMLADKTQAPGIGKRLIRHLQDEGLADNTITNVCRHLRAVLTWAVESGHLPELPTSVLTSYKHRSKDGKQFALTLDEVLQFTRHQYEDPTHTHARDVFVLQAFTGLRFSDVFKLSGADASKTTFSLVMEKTGRTVEIPIVDVLRPILARYPNGIPQCTNQHLNRKVKEAAQLAGLTRSVTQTRTYKGKDTPDTQPAYAMIATHTARRSFVSIAQAMGIHDATIKAVTGHSRVSQLQTYSLPDQSTEAERLGKLFSEALDKQVPL